MHSHLTQQKRIELSLMLRLGYSQRKTALSLGIHPSTVSRELKRNRRPSGMYHPRDARMFARVRRAKANGLRIKLLTNHSLARLVELKLRSNWAPEQIAGWLRATRKSACVCAQTIYDWIYRFRRDLLPHLHCRKGKYRHTRDNALRKAFRDSRKAARHISRRPAHVMKRTRYGHWEGDTVRGNKHSGYIATFVERKSGYLMAVKISKSTAHAFEQAASSCFKHIPGKYTQTLTLDNGSEMNDYEAIEHRTGLKVYFATPYHSWERGTNENTNGLLRFYFPKKMSFKELTQEQLDLAVHEINTRPRKRLAYQTPESMFKRNW